MDEPISKSQKKREADELQKLGVALTQLSAEQLAKLPLTDVLRHAINEAKRLKSHGAVRRQAQLIGKLMRAAENEAIRVAYGEMQAEQEAKTEDFHAVEMWRARLIQEGNTALTEFVDQFHPADVQQLRQLIKKAQDEQVRQINHGASRALFRFIKSCIV